MNLKPWWQHCWLPACLLLVAITHTVSSETRVVCYYTNWSVYRPGTAKFSPQNINPYLCTHLIYAFGGFTKENSLKPFDKYQDIEKGGYAKFTGLKTYNKNLKTMLAIGGWNEGSSRFSPMVASADRRKELVKNSIKFLRQNHFDGLDLDWEYPSFRDGGKARDKDNYAQLVQELREEFDRESEKTGRPRLLLTMAVPAGIEYINKGYDIPKLNKYLDWMNILSYDYHSAFEPAVNHHSPLYPLEEDNEYNFDGDLNIDHTIKHYLKLGADSTKLVLGIPTYGRSYTLFNPDANELGAPADGPGDMGDATRENGYLAFYEICENLKENDWKIVQPNPEAMGPYAYKDNQWVSYDDELIVKKKSVYVAENNLGGIMFWSIDNDDFRGNCYNKPYPLIEAAKEALITAASSKTEDNLVKPRKPTQRPRRPTSSLKKDSDATTTNRVQNSGGRQSSDEASASSGRKRIRTNSRSKSRSEDTNLERNEERKRPRTRGSGRRRKTTTTTPLTTVTHTTPSTLPTTPMYKTPEPPTTPDPGGAEFKCEEDGFFPHPKDCKKYFWCLSGPADLGIIAHQFTCPAGLYFNKAADSCDYTQNVLCNKKLKTTSTTTTPATTTTSTTTAAPSTTTRRAPARITAATSKTTFLYTSTTTTEEPEYYDEYEYEDEEDLEDEAPRRGEPESEEDPKVIKELIDLIKKVGGVEELEKFLKLQEDGSMAVTQGGSTTPASISRSLYERVLQSRNNAAKTNTNTGTTTKTRNSLTYSTINRNRGSAQTDNKEETVTEATTKRGNSRFTPQNEGLERPETSNDNSIKRGRPQYTTINRQRASTERSAEAENESDDEEYEEEVETKKTRQFPSRQQTTPEYVTIRRTRPTSATEPEIDDEDTPRSSTVRSRQRGIPGETDEDDLESTLRPEYVTIRRQRPAVEETTTSRYITIQRKRPTTENSEDAETTTDLEASKYRSTTQSPEEDSLEKDKRFRSTTLSSTDETSTLTSVDTTLEDNKRTTTETQSTTETIVKSTLEETTDSTADKTASVTPATELPTTDVTSEASNQISETSPENQPEKEVISEKPSPSPQLFRPRPFATRVRSTTTSKPTDPTSTTEPTKKVSDSIGKPSVRPTVRKFQPGNRFRAQTGTQSLDNDSSKIIVSTTEENGTQEIETNRDEEYRRRVANRGRSKFTIPTSTVEPTVARRRRPQVSVTADYEYDEEEVQRTYRPTLLADLSSLTSADIAFQRNSNRKHIRRRPVSQTSSTTSAQISSTETTTETSLKTGPRTLTLARKQINESAFGRNSRRILNQKNDTSVVANNSNESSTKSTLFAKPRPVYSTLLRSSTTQKSTTEQSDIEAETTKIRTRFSEAPPLIRTTEESTTESNEINTVTEEDSTESNSDKEYKTVDPETNEITEIPIISTTETQVTTTSPTTTPSPTTTITSSTERNIRRSRPTTTQAPTTITPEVPKLNRTRKVFTNRRIRTTTSSPIDIESSNTETIRTTVDFKRQRPSFTATRNNSSLRPNITRLRPIKSDALDTNTTSESNRSLVKRIRPIGLASKIDEEERIKLSETNISENGYLAQNLPEDDSGKFRRRKIVRRIRPSKDTVFSKTEEDELKARRIKINDSSVLTTEENVQDTEGTARINGRFSSVTTETPEAETELNKRIRSNNSLFRKSESIDILRSKRIRYNNTERDETKSETNRQGKSSISDDEFNTENIGTSTTDSEFELTDNYSDQTNSNIEDQTTTTTDTDNQETIKRPNSPLFKPPTTIRNRATNSPTTKLDTPSTFRPSIRRFRPETIETTTSRLIRNGANIKFIETNRSTNRTRKIIRRLRPTTTTTTEAEIAPSTITEASVSTTTENIIPTTSEIEDDATEFVVTTEYLTTLVDTDDTTMFTTETESTTTTTTTPRPTRPSLIGRSRPAYRPRSRPVVEIRSTTPIVPGTFRRKLIGLGKNEPSNQSTEKDETEDGIIDSKLKKLYSKKQKFTPIVRSTTERLKALEEEKTIEKAIVEEEEKTNDETRDTTTIDDNTSDKTIDETKNTTTIDDNSSDKTIDKELKTTETEQPEIVTTEDSNDLTTIPETEITTIYLTELPITEIKTDESTTEIKSDTTTQNQSNTESTTVSKTTETSTTDSTPESSTENTEIITENNTEIVENPTTEYIAETTLLGSSDKLQSSTQVSTQESSTSETTTNLDSTSNEPSTTENEKQESDRSYKPIRYKPSDRPKLRIKLNRTETDSDKNDNDEPRNRKFTPSRTIDQRNRSKLAYRKDVTTEKSKDRGSERNFVPRGRKIERPVVQLNQNNNEETDEEYKIDEEDNIKEEVVENKSERTHYPTLKPVSERFNFNRNQDENDEESIEEEEEVQEEEDPPVRNPLVKYLQTIRNNQEVIKTTVDQPEPEEINDDEDQPSVEEPELEEDDEEYVDEEEEEPQIDDKDESTKFNIPIVHKPNINRPPVQNVPTRVVNRPQYTPNRPVLPNEPRRPPITSGNRPFNPNEGNRPFVPNRHPVEVQRPTLESNTPILEPYRPTTESNRPILESNRPILEPIRPILEPNRPVEDSSTEPNSSVESSRGTLESNRPVVEQNRPNLESNRPLGISANRTRNYPRKFNKPVVPTSSTTTESLGINLEAVNARNKNLYSKNRKVNIPHPGPVVSTEDPLTINSTISSTTTETTTPSIEMSQVTEETILPEPTTEQLSTLHHVFAEPDIPTTPVTTTVEASTKYNFTAAQLEAARNLERLIEVNRIVEVSLKENKVHNGSGIVETRVMLEQVPTLERRGAINRVTVIKVVDGSNETEASNVPSNHAVTLNEIVTGKRIDTNQKIDIVAKLHAPDIDLTKMNILNNTLEIIETQRRDDISQEEITTTGLPIVTEIIPEGIPVHIVNGPKILDQIINDTVVVNTNQDAKKFEINSKSNVIDYSHRELDPIQILASAQPANQEDVKQGRKLAIDSKSVVVNNHNRPVFHEATTLPLEALFQTDSPDADLLKDVVTQLPKETTSQGNDVDDDQDLLESRNVNGRVRIRILGQDNDFTQIEKDTNPVFAPIRLLSDEEKVTLKADVIEVTRKPQVETIKIAPIEVSLSEPQTSPSRPYFFRRPSLRYTPAKPSTTTSPSSAPLTTTSRPVRSPPRRRFTTRDRDNVTTSTSGALGTSASQQVLVSTTAKPRFKFAPRRPFLKPSTSTTTSSTESTSHQEVEDLEDPMDTISNENANDGMDQMIEPSIQRVKSHEHQDNSIQDLGDGSKVAKGKGEEKKGDKDSLEEIGEIGLSLYQLNKAPLPSRRRPAIRRGSTTESSSTVGSSTERVLSPFDRLRTRHRSRTSSTAPPLLSTPLLSSPPPPTTSTTPPPQVPRNTLRRRRPQPQAFERVTPAPVIITTGSYKPITIEYDYYDEGDVRILGQLPANSKVLIHASGVIQCLDQGNFPHPISCKKFISCAKMENGDVIGWEYTCPNRLSFDPVGGICNWSSGLGCKE